MIGLTIAPAFFVPPDWIPLSPTQTVDAAVSTALAIPTASGAGFNPRGAVYVAVLAAFTQDQWLRFDGGAAAASTGLLLKAGSFAVVMGLPTLKATRFIQSAGGGALSASFFFYSQ